MTDADFIETDLRHAPAYRRAEALALNAGVEAMTSPLTPERLDQLLSWSCAAPALVAQGRVRAFLLGFDEAAPYDSPNYRWFRARLPRFAYIDRVVVADAARGRGLARRLYAAFAARSPGAACLACEVNLVPPNPGSDAFHAALGFAELGRDSPAPGKVVRYLTRPIGPGQNGLTTTT